MTLILVWLRINVIGVSEMTNFSQFLLLVVEENSF